MKITNQADEMKKAVKTNGIMTMLYNRNTGKEQLFHTIDALDIMKKMSSQWSYEPIVDESAIEDAVIVAEPSQVDDVKEVVESAEIIEPSKPMVETMRQRKDRLKAEAKLVQDKLGKQE